MTTTHKITTFLLVLALVAVCAVIIASSSMRDRAVASAVYDAVNSIPPVTLEYSKAGYVESLSVAPGQTVHVIEDENSRLIGVRLISPTKGDMGAMQPPASTNH